MKKVVIISTAVYLVLTPICNISAFAQELGVSDESEMVSPKQDRETLMDIQLIEQDLGFLEKEIDKARLSVEETLKTEKLIAPKIEEEVVREPVIEEKKEEVAVEPIVEEKAEAEPAKKAEAAEVAKEAEVVEPAVEEEEKKAEAPEPAIEEEKEFVLESVELKPEEEPPLKISGEFTVSLGSTMEDTVIWKDAHGDYNETNWRRVDGNFGYNTYDRRIFDRLRVDIDTENEEGFDFHSNITIDPWSFIGKSDKTTISSDWDDTADIQLKYWSGTRRTINETIYSKALGNSFSLPEVKVNNEKVPSFTEPGIVWDTGLSDTFNIPELEIHQELWPIREFWIDYNKGDKFQFRFFPIAHEDQALTSDDPLGLSNHRIYWEESPWLDRWQPGVLNTGTAPVDFTRGKWEDDLSYFTRDSNMTRLTSLRGFSIKSKPWENLSIESTAASPKGLWQDYDAFDNIQGATRIKFTPRDELLLGLVHTFRYGLEESERDAENRVIAGDICYQFTPDFQVKGEVAYSEDERDLTQESYDTKNVGNAYRFELKKGRVKEERPEKWDEEAQEEEEEEEVEPFDWALRLTCTHMDKGFYPALANYRISRKDPFWGRHLHFKEPYKEYYGGLYYPTLTWYDIRLDRIGDSVDVDRDVVGLRLEKAFFDEDLELLFDCRNAHEASSAKYIETIGRLETDWQANEKLLIKVLGIYHDLPKTTGGIDPIYYDVDTNKFMIYNANNLIEDGKDPTLKTVSGGFKYDFFDWLSFDCIYERTNDFTVGLDDYPRRLLKDLNMTTYTENGVVWREPTYLLNLRGFFPAPPYPWFNIYKAGLEVEPNDDLKLRLEFTKNDYKYAGQIDDNINHLGFAADWDITEKFSLKFNYTYSKSYDIYRQTIGAPEEYDSHHNVFVNLDYKMEDKGVLSLQFGEAALLPYVVGITTSPYPGYLPTLDTVHIVRGYFSRKF